MTFKYAVGVVLAVHILTFLLAYLLTKGYRGQGVYRTGFFIPNLIGGVVLHKMNYVQMIKHG